MILYSVRFDSSRCALTFLCYHHIQCVVPWFILWCCSLQIANITVSIFNYINFLSNRWWWSNKMKDSKCSVNRQIGLVKYWWGFMKSWVIRISEFLDYILLCSIAFVFVWVWVLLPGDAESVYDSEEGIWNIYGLKYYWGWSKYQYIESTDLICEAHGNKILRGRENVLNCN